LIVFDVLGLGIIGDAHRWIMSHLTDRKQRVIINYSMLTYSYITCGVPQGSVLGSLMSLLYQTGLRDIIEPFTIEYMLYADDLQLYLSFPVRDLPSTVIKKQECFQAVKTWLSTLYL
jgi:hypothetical protein